MVGPIPGRIIFAHELVSDRYRQPLRRPGRHFSLFALELVRQNYEHRVVVHRARPLTFAEAKHRTSLATSVSVRAVVSELLYRLRRLRDWNRILNSSNHVFSRYAVVPILHPRHRRRTDLPRNSPSD